jgi:hypothetical protein
MLTKLVCMCTCVLWKCGKGSLFPGLKLLEHEAGYSLPTVVLRSIKHEVVSPHSVQAFMTLSLSTREKIYLSFPGLKEASTQC